MSLFQRALIAASLLGGLLWFLGALGLFVIVKPAGAHDIYESWHPPGNPKTSCCNNSDCRPTRSWLGDDGLWRAWSGTGWLIVPSDRVLPMDYAGDGRSHLCEKGSFIYCFSPTQPRG